MRVLTAYPVAVVELAAPSQSLGIRYKREAISSATVILGEVPSVGVAPAIANALYDAIGVRFTRLPITPDRVLDALAKG